MKLANGSRMGDLEEIGQQWDHDLRGQQAGRLAGGWRQSTEHFTPASQCRHVPSRVTSLDPIAWHWKAESKQAGGLMSSTHLFQSLTGRQSQVADTKGRSSGGQAKEAPGPREEGALFQGKTSLNSGPKTCQKLTWISCSLQRMQYNKRFVNVTLTGGKRRMNPKYALATSP